ncbi:hypothetical protein [Haloferula sargassicola]|uniref:Uncharacterized protein n=1 Tax=Haloferula sargassicola TaxID=490096 RepID=A0ABP9URU7_9BACT
MIAALLALVAAAGSANPMTAQFANGDQVHGELRSISDSRFGWQADWLGKAAEFVLDDLNEIRIPTAREAALPEGEHTARVILSNGDQLRGVLRALDDEKVILRTQYAGDLTLRRDMVASLDIRDRAVTLFRGPSSMEGWTLTDEKSWDYADGALVCRGSGGIRRDVGRHQKISVSLDITWNERTDLSLRTHGKPGKDKDGELETFYELACQNQYISFRKRIHLPGGRRTQIQPIGSVGAVDDLNREGVVRLEMQQDIEKGVFRLIIGDRVVSDWRDNDPDAGDFGPFLELRSQQSAGTRVSRIQVESWDGILEGGFQTRRNFMGDAEPEEPEPEDFGSKILLRNGDAVEGGIREIEDGMVTVHSELKDFSLPVSRLRTFALRSEDDAKDPEKFWKPIRRNGDIRAWFADGGAVTFRLDSFENGELTGTSQTFGTATFDFSVFSRIEFNLYRTPSWFAR